MELRPATWLDLMRFSADRIFGPVDPLFIPGLPMAVDAIGEADSVSEARDLVESAVAKALGSPLNRDSFPLIIKLLSRPRSQKTIRSLIGVFGAAAWTRRGDRGDVMRLFYLCAETCAAVEGTVYCVLADDGSGRLEPPGGAVPPPASGPGTDWVAPMVDRVVAVLGDFPRREELRTRLGKAIAVACRAVSWLAKRIRIVPAEATTAPAATEKPDFPSTPRKRGREETPVGPRKRPLREGFLVPLSFPVDPEAFSSHGVRI